jgi:2-polyprenyl-3-methyl-5-hydroxy-6-metoxy-1,4-benzoquinol methylase
MNGPTPLLRRVGRWVRRVPVAGPFARDAYVVLEHRLWRHLLIPLRNRRLAFANRVKDFANSRSSTASNVTRRNTRRAYQRLYSSDRLLDEYLAPTRLAFYGQVATTVADLKPSSVIDVGCGTGHLLRAVLDRTVVVDAVGIDYAPAAIARAEKVVPEASLAVGDLTVFTSERTFDVVLCTEVLEHLRDPEDARATLARLARPLGHIVATVPDGENDEWEGHVNFWSLEEFRSFLRPLGEAEVRRIDGDVLLALVTVRRAPDS